MLRTASKVFGAVFLLVGVLGFVPQLTPDGNLLGLFHVNTLHNIVHLASGAVALMAGFYSDQGARRYFQVFGVVYALVAILGLMAGDNAVLGLVANNTADNLLHIVIAATSLYLGFGRKSDAAVA